MNDEFDADHFLYYIKTTLLNSSGLGGYIIVYGSSVDAYCCLRVLLNCGIRGIKILFARKALEPNEPTSFNNPLVSALPSPWVLNILTCIYFTKSSRNSQEFPGLSEFPICLTKIFSAFGIAYDYQCYLVSPNSSIELMEKIA